MKRKQYREKVRSIKHVSHQNINETIALGLLYKNIRRKNLLSSSVSKSFKNPETLYVDDSQPLSCSTFYRWKYPYS